MFYLTLKGGLRPHKTVYIDMVDLIFNVNAEKLVGWKGASFCLYVAGNNGDDISGNIGEAQVVSNIECEKSWQIAELWYQQNFSNDKISFKIGLYDLNSEFDVNETGSLFLNSSQGFGHEYGQSGVNGPSLAPVTSLAIRFKVSPTENFYLQAAVLDGVSGDPGDTRGTQIVLKKEDGALIAVEAGYTLPNDHPWGYGKYSVGGWYYTSKFDDILATDDTGAPIRRRGNSGFYVFAEQTIFQEEDKDQGLAMYVRAGFADSKVNQYDMYVGGGIVYTGFIPTRGKDKIGFALAFAHNSSDYRKLQKLEGNEVKNYELVLEWTYKVELTPWFYLQPNLQYVINPSTEKNIKDAVALGFRFGFNL